MSPIKTFLNTFSVVCVLAFSACHNVEQTTEVNQAQIITAAEKKQPYDVLLDTMVNGNFFTIKYNCERRLVTLFFGNKKGIYKYDIGNHSSTFGSAPLVTTHNLNKGTIGIEVLCNIVQLGVGHESITLYQFNPQSRIIKKLCMADGLPGIIDTMANEVRYEYAIDTVKQALVVTTYKPFKTAGCATQTTNYSYALPAIGPEMDKLVKRLISDDRKHYPTLKRYYTDVAFSSGDNWGNYFSSYTFAHNNHKVNIVNEQFEPVRQTVFIDGKATTAYFYATPDFNEETLDLSIDYAFSEYYTLPNYPGYILVASQPTAWCGLSNAYSVFQLINTTNCTVAQFIGLDLSKEQV